MIFTPCTRSLGSRIIIISIFNFILPQDWYVLHEEALTLSLSESIMETCRTSNF